MIADVFVTVMDELPVMLTLTKFPSYGRSNDSYSACGGCVGIDKLYPRSSWTCSKPAKITKKVVTAFMNVYQKCDFKWRWHNLEYDDSDARAHEFNRSSRELSIQEECDDSLITKVETEWDIKRDKVTGDCVSAPAPSIITTTETTPTSTPSASRATTANDPQTIPSDTTLPTTIGFSSSKAISMKEKTPGPSQSTSEPAKDISATKITEGTESTTSGTSTNLPNTPARQTTDDRISVESATPSLPTDSTGRHTQNSYGSTDNVTQTIHMTSGEASQVSVSTTELTVLVTNISSAHTRPTEIRGSTRPSNNSQLESGLLQVVKLDLSSSCRT